MNLGLEYIKYRWNGKRNTGLPSSFIKGFTHECLKTEIDPSVKSKFKNLLNTLKSNHKEIDIKDFGAGSKKLNSTRKVSSILKTSSSKGKYGKLLHQLSKHYEPKNILELGTSLGIGTVMMKTGYLETDITTIEACPNTFKLSLNTFKQINIDVNSINDTFKSYFESKNDGKSFDLVFIDGHHDGEALIDYLTQLSPYTHDKTIFVLDDIRWSTSMLSAWNEIVESKNFNTSIDLFRMGIVIGNQNLKKEHHTILL